MIKECFPDENTNQQKISIELVILKISDSMITQNRNTVIKTIAEVANLKFSFVFCSSMPPGGLRGVFKWYFLLILYDHFYQKGE